MSKPKDKKEFSEKHVRAMGAFAMTLGMNFILQVQSKHTESPFPEQDTDALIDNFILELRNHPEWVVIDK